MTSESCLPQAATTTSGLEPVMKSSFYNDHAATQTDALQHLLPLLQRAAQLVLLPSGPLQVSCSHLVTVHSLSGMACAYKFKFSATMVKCLQAVVVQSSTAPHDARQLPVPCTNQAGNAAHNGGAATKTTGTAKVAGAAAELTLTQCSVCLQVAEFGCSGGINSVAPVKTLVHTLDQRLQQQQTEQQALHIHVTHEDLPSNDFVSAPAQQP